MTPFFCTKFDGKFNDDFNLELGPPSGAPKIPYMGGNLLTLKRFKLRQSVTPFFYQKFDGKFNGDINLELGTPHGAPKAPHIGGHLLTWKV